MYKTINLIFVVSVILFITSCKQTSLPDYKNPDLPIEDRVDDLLSRMNTEEKFWQLFMIPEDLSTDIERYKHGIFGLQVSTSGKNEQLLNYDEGADALRTAETINKIQKYFVEKTRLGIPIIPFDEALHGLIRKDAVVFPQSIGLAATWDTTLMKQVADAIAEETRSRGIRQILSPVINISRDVRWGRTEETYGEDPFLTTQMALAYIIPFENKGIITTPKHFIANVGDGGRDSYPIHFNERLLKEVYFPAFKACITKGKAGSIMTSYNSLDGRPCTANNWLLNETLKKEWGFDGFVISDAGATGGANVLHFTANNYTESTKQAIENGLDVIFQTSFDHYPLFIKAFKEGLIDETAVDEAVRRVLRAKFKLGLFEHPYVDIKESSNKEKIKKHKQIAKKAALKSIVLLKNVKQTLPLKKNIKSIAVLGTDAAEPRFGGYSGPGNDPVSILEGIKQKIGKSCKVNFAPGPGRNTIKFITIPTEYLYFVDDMGEKQAGLKGEYYNNIYLKGKPDLIRADEHMNFSWTLYSPNKDIINYDQYSVKWTGKLKAPKSGNYKIGIEGDDGYRLYINNELIIDNRKKQTYRRVTSYFPFMKDKEYDIRLEFFETAGNARLNLIWNIGLENTGEKLIKEAIALAQKSEVIIMAAGIEEGEFRDRAYLSLPGEQEKLINELVKIGKPLVIILVGGSAVTMQNWINTVPAVLDVWYPGEEGGHAVADVLFGDYNPAGRLPISFPIHESQLPLFYNHKPTGRGDDYNNLSGKALFPFGFGLSYTNFEYSDLNFDKRKIKQGEQTRVYFKVKNTGGVDGDEVIQLYIRDLLASVVRPVKELKGFQRIYLKAGETKKLFFDITPDLLSMVDQDMNRIVETGEFRIMIGASSVDIKLAGNIELIK